MWLAVPLFGILPKLTNQLGGIETRRGNPREPSHHLNGQCSSSGHFLAIVAEVLISVVTAII